MIAPKHVAIIMDGNGRWAQRRALDRNEGHGAGEDAIGAAVDAALDAGVEWLTLFAFSTENWDRPAREVAFLMSFARHVIHRHGDDYHRRGIRVRYLGQDDVRIPAPLRGDMLAIQERTAANERLNLTFAFNYGGRAEIVAACRRILASGLSSDEIDETTFGRFLQFPELPDPDLIVRTSGEHRLSNFLLWGAAYAELVFLDVLWPDFRAAHFAQAIGAYNSRTRTYGSVVPQPST